MSSKKTEEKRLIRLQMDFSDGTIQVLTGREAERWLKEANSFVAVQSLRTGGSEMTPKKWKTYKLVDEKKEI